MIQQTFNPPLKGHLSPIRPIDWATKPTHRQVMRKLLKATVNAARALIELGFVAGIAKRKFMAGGLVWPRL